MTIDAVTAQIQARLQGVSGIGVVYAYERWAKDWNTVLNLFKTSSNTFHGWTISRTKTARRQITLGELESAHVFVIRGIFALNDSEASETTFQSLMESISEAVDTDETLGGTVDTTHPDWGPMSGAAGLQIDEVGVRMFGGVLCHYAECRLCAAELRQ